MTQKAPRGLSKEARAVWIALHESHSFEPHEDYTLLRGLHWQDVSDRLLAEAGMLRGRERSARLRSSAEAAVISLKFRKAVKLEDPEQPVRRPGRPPGSWATRAAVAQIRGFSGEV